MTKIYLVIVRLALLLTYVWLVREFYLFLYVDSCLDGGGIVSNTTGLCLDARLGEGGDIGVNATFILWVFLLGLPALVVWGAYALLSPTLRSRGTPQKRGAP